MRLGHFLVLLAIVAGCRSREAPASLPEGWKRVVVDRVFTIDVPESMGPERQRHPTISMDGDRWASDGDSLLEGPERRLLWAWWRRRQSYHHEGAVRRARKQPVGWTLRASSDLVSLRPGFTDAASVVETHVLMARGRRVIEASVLEPVPNDSVTARRILGSIRFLSDGE